MPILTCSLPEDLLKQLSLAIEKLFMPKNNIIEKHCDKPYKNNKN